MSRFIEIVTDGYEAKINLNLVMKVRYYRGKSLEITYKDGTVDRIGVISVESQEYLESLYKKIPVSF